MNFTTPIPFQEALDQLVARDLLPTSAGSRQLRDELAPQIRERAWFSARVTETRFLDRMRDVITRLTSPAAQLAQGARRINRADARLALKQQLAEIGWDPTEKGVVPGSLQDLTSDGRLNLIIDTNKAFADGYGDWAAGQDQDILDAFPAQELVRVVDAEEPRDWVARFLDAGGQLYGGRMIAPKNDPIWVAISAFGLPYEPFDFNSGMGLQDVGYREAVDLGVIQPGQRIAPAETGFDRDVRARAPAADSLLLDLVRAFPDRLDADGEELVLKPRKAS